MSLVVLCPQCNTIPLLLAKKTLSVVAGEKDEENSKGSWKSKGSPQLNRWSRARSLRIPKKQPEFSLESGHENAAVLIPSINTPTTNFEEEDTDDDDGVENGKAIYMVSDGTGWTAEHSVNAALGQFENCLVDRGCAVHTHLFSGVEDEERLLEIVRQAAKEKALLLYTLADPNMADAAERACNLWRIPNADILGPTTDAIGAHLGVEPSGIPRGSPTRKTTLSKHYFKTIEAVEFTIKQDDGALPQNLHKADIVLTGVSRTSKTPLSMYLAQKGYKVANVPLVLGLKPPSELFGIDQKKIFALTINPVILQAIRLTRARTLGLEQPRTSYSDMTHVREELQDANRLFANNPQWPVIDVTGKAIEETAAIILRTYHEKKQKNWKA